MTELDSKADLRIYLQDAREALLWKLEGSSEYGLRRPMTPTGTNLLGLVKHLTGAEAAYFGEAFDRPFTAPPLWVTGDAEPNSDLWATADETRDEIVGLYRSVWVHSDATIGSLPLDTTGQLVSAGRGAPPTPALAAAPPPAALHRHSRRAASPSARRGESPANRRDHPLGRGRAQLARPPERVGSERRPRRGAAAHGQERPGGQAQRAAVGGALPLVVAASGETTLASTAIAPSGDARGVTRSAEAPSWRSRDRSPDRSGARCRPAWRARPRRGRRPARRPA